MKKPQWITIGAALVLTLALFVFGRTVPAHKTAVAETHSEDDGHDHGPAPAAVTIDSILIFAKKQLTGEQLSRITMLENSISRGDVRAQQLKVFHQLSHFWGDSMRFFPAYGWYEAEAARLENSEKNLTFAARLFLDYMQQESDAGLRKWEAQQAKDLFERSLAINPANDSAKVGLGSCYLFGGISDNPMEGIKMIREVTERDSTNVYAQLTLGRGAMMTGQLDKAIERLETVNRVDPSNVEAILMLADTHERMKHNTEAIKWYTESLKYIHRQNVRADIENRIAELKK